MRYVEARFAQEKRDTAYRIYVTEGLKALTANTSGTSKSVLSKNYLDLLAENSNNNSVDNRTKEEVISHIREKMTLLTGG